MNFTGAIETCFKKYATFKGRARRSEFWWWQLFVNIIFLIITLINSSNEQILVLNYIFFIFVLPTLTVTVRRLQDIGKSGRNFWLVLFFIGSIFRDLSRGADQSLAIMSIGMLFTMIGLIPLCIWWCRDSQGENKYGA